MQRVRLTTRGGVQDLGRVVNALALMDLTPVSFSAITSGDGLRIEAWLQGDSQRVLLCVERLRVFPAICRADVTAFG